MTNKIDPPIENPAYNIVKDPLDRIRYYKGKYKCIRITKKSYIGPVLYRMLEEAVVGSEQTGYKNVKPGELIAGPIKAFHKNKSEDDIYT